MTQPEAICGTCRFYRQQSCRRWPPQFKQDGAYSETTAWPTPRFNDWCGEYQPTIENRSTAGGGQ